MKNKMIINRKLNKNWINKMNRFCNNNSKSNKIILSYIKSKKNLLTQAIFIFNKNKIILLNKKKKKINLLIQTILIFNKNINKQVNNKM